MADPEKSALPRRPRGEARRDRLVEATLALLERDGLEAVTHRRVAELAGVPLAATTYYFGSKNELLQAAMAHHTAREAAELRAIAEGVIAADLTLEEGIDAMVAWQVAALRDHRQASFAQLELYLRVARTAGPPPGGAWTAPFHAMAEAVFGHFGSPDPAVDARELSGLVNGLVLEALTTAAPGEEEAVIGPPLRAFLSERLGH